MCRTSWQTCYWPPQRKPTDHLSTLFQGSEHICIDRSGGGGHEITERLSGYHGWFWPGERQPQLLVNSVLTDMLLLLVIAKQWVNPALSWKSCISHYCGPAAGDDNLCTLLLLLFLFDFHMRDFSLKLRRIQLFNRHALCHTVAGSHVSSRWDTKAQHKQCYTIDTVMLMMWHPTHPSMATPHWFQHSARVGVNKWWEHL